MATNTGPKLVTGSMSLYIDAANKKSLNTIGDGWSDLTGNTPNFVFGNATFNPVNQGIVNFTGATGSIPNGGSRADGSFTQSTEMTWDVWFKREQSQSSEGHQFNIVFEHPSTPYLSFGTSADASRFLFSWHTRMGTDTSFQRTLATSPIYTDKTWYNVTCTLKRDLAATTTTANIYVNGILVASSTTAVGTNDQIWPNLSIFRLATNGTNGTYPFKGSISNFRIYRRILTDAEILQNYNSQKTRFLNDIVSEGLKFYVDAIDKRSFTRISNGWTDMTGNYGTLTFVGVGDSTEASGTLGFYQLYDDGNINSYAETNNVFTQSSEMTWDIWFNRTSSINGFNMLFSNSVPYLAFRSTGNFYFYWYTELDGEVTTNTLSSQSIYTNNIWYNVVCTLIQDTVAMTSTANMYVNGVLVASSTTAPGTLDNVYQAGRLRIGNYAAVGYPFNGRISSLKIYNRILTESEILQNYNAQKSRFGH